MDIFQRAIEVLPLYFNVYRVLEVIFFTTVHILGKVFICLSKNVQKDFTKFF